MGREKMDMGARIFAEPGALLDAVGETFGPTAWLTVEQQRIDLFADATGDHQWIHVDAVRAAEGPFGETIAHGFLTLSLIAHFLPQLIQVERVAMSVNVGSDRTRFLSPVKCRARIRAEGELISAKKIGGGVQVVIRVTVTIENIEKPALQVDSISRIYPE